MKAIAVCGLFGAGFLSAAQASDLSANSVIRFSQRAGVPMKKVLLVLSLVCSFTATSFAQTFTLSGINAWVGTGANQSALVIDWHDANTPTSLVWGYRWDGSATVTDMMQAIDAADPRLLISLHPLYDAVFSIYYDLTGNGGTPTIGVPFDLGGTENGFAPFPGDHYQEGWYTGFWGLLNGNGNPYNGGSWVEAAAGASSTMLENNSFHAFSMTRDLVNFTIPDAGLPTAVTLVPEPSCTSLLAFVLSGGAAWRLRKHFTNRLGA
ncbi:MAG: hypothetical protein NTZ46_01080 [Verrucomicrobia bacterium]|nr:hypothetical protein [Verrucomicrobiota bacterium]